MLGEKPQEVLPIFQTVDLGFMLRWHKASLTMALRRQDSLMLKKSIGSLLPPLLIFILTITLYGSKICHKF